MITSAITVPEIVLADSGIASANQISPQDFLDHHIRQNLPLKMTGMMDAWPAMQNWNLKYFRSLNSETEVHLEVGNVMQGDTEFKKNSFAEFVDRIINDDGNGDKEYLSVFKIFEHFPQLKKDVDFSILNQHKLKHSMVGWIGPAGTVTGYHVDWGDNILAQIYGRKELLLAPPSATENMYVSKKFDQGATLSDVDVDNFDEAQFPKFKKVRHHQVTLNPGEMIFIPRGWWHLVRSLDKSISVSNLTYDLKGMLVDALPGRIKQTLHDAGIWKCPCTCHVIRDGKWVKK